MQCQINFTPWGGGGGLAADGPGWGYVESFIATVLYRSQSHLLTHNWLLEDTPTDPITLHAYVSPLIGTLNSKCCGYTEDITIALNYPLSACQMVFLE